MRVKNEDVANEIISLFLLGKQTQIFHSHELDSKYLIRKVIKCK